MTTNEQHAQLDTILELYETWRARNGEIRAAAEEYDRLEEGEFDFNLALVTNEYAARAAVAIAVLRYSELCDATEQDLTDCVGVAFIQALHVITQKERAAGLTEAAIARSDEQHDGWARAYAAGETTAQRPALPAVGALVTAVSDWWGHLRETEIDSTFDATTAAAVAAGVQNIRERSGVDQDGNPYRTLTWDFLVADGDDADAGETEKPEPPKEDALKPGALIPVGVGKGLREAVSRRSWRVVRRQYGQARWLEEHPHSAGPRAFAAAQEGRLELADNEVIDIYRLRTNGWLLLDSLPPLTAREVAPPNGEWVYGELEPAQTVGPDAEILSYGVIGAIYPNGVLWEVKVRVRGEEIVASPLRARDALHTTRRRAIAAVRGLWKQQRDHPIEDVDSGT